MHRYRKPSIECVEDRLALTSFLNFDLQWLTHSFSRLETDDNDSTASAVDLGELDGDRTVRGRVGGSDVRDVYGFILQDYGQVNVGLADLSADADLYLLDGGRSIVARSENAGPRNESIKQQLEAGEYFVIVERYRYRDATNFRLDLTATATPDAAGSTFATAVDVGLVDGSRSFEGSVGFGADKADVIQFTVDTQSNVNLQLSALSADLDLYLFNASQQRLASSVLPANSSERIDVSVGEGSYYLAVVPYRGAESTYDLHISQKDANPATTLQPVPSTPVAAPDTPVSSELGAVNYFGSVNEWGLNQVNAPEAWSAGYTGRGVTVAVVDTGIDLTHPDLVDSIWENADEILGDGIDNDRNGFIDDRYGWDFVADENNPSDGNGHGTHVAGIVTAANNGVGATGVAFEAQVMPIRVLNNEGSGSNFGVARGIRYAVDNGADVINLSLGGGYDSTIYSAIRYAYQNDVFVVAAAGNESATVPSYPAGHSTTLANVVSVGAFDRQGQPASFSNRVGNSGAVQVDAPGVSIYSTVPSGRYQRLSGTSMAAPYVSGVAALTLAAHPQLTSVELREALVEGATTGVEGSDAVGAINAARSIPLALA